MPIMKIYNPLVTSVLNTIRKTDASLFEVYSSISHATTILAGDVAKNMDYYDVHKNTAFGQFDTKSISKSFRIVTRIRAGLPMAESLWQFFKCVSKNLFNTSRQKIKKPKTN